MEVNIKTCSPIAWSVFTATVWISYLALPDILPTVGSIARAVEPESVLAAWRQRQEKIPWLLFDWDEEFTVAKGALGPLVSARAGDSSEPSPPEHMTLPGHCSLLLGDHGGRYSEDRQQWSRAKRQVIQQTFEEICDGNEIREFFSKSALEDPQGSLRREVSISELLARDASLPIVLCYRVLHPDFHVFEVKGVRVRVVGSANANANAVIASFVHGEGRVDLWLDPDREFIVTQYFVIDRDEKTTYDLNVTYRSEGPREWIPSQWNSRSFDSEGHPMFSRRVTVNGAVLNEALIGKRLALEFPPGTRVNDITANEAYVVLPSGKKHVLSDYEKGMSSKEILIREKRYRTFAYIGVGMLLVLVVVVAATIYARRRLAR